MNPTALVLLDFFGIAVYAISGALVAAERRLDFVTFIFFAAVTGVGGGTLRDLLIGAPVFWIQNNGILVICVLAASFVWLVRRRRFTGRHAPGQQRRDRSRVPARIDECIDDLPRRLRRIESTALQQQRAVGRFELEVEPAVLLAIALDLRQGDFSTSRLE